MIGGHCGGSLTTKQAHHVKESANGDRSRVTIDMLPDVALLRIFDFCVDEEWEKWHKLVHVCRYWRSVVFGSPRRLDLRLYLYCSSSPPMREMLDLWPPLPMVIRVYYFSICDMDNVFAALEHNDRIRELSLSVLLITQLNQIFPKMQRPFPELTYLEIQPKGGIPAVVPDSFLGGSAPRLQSLWLYQIPFPGLPNLLLSATHLVELDLWEIPHSGYISPEAMVTCLSASTRLERIFLWFDSPQCRPDRKGRRPPPQTRALIPALTKWGFIGVSDYLEDLVALIDSPLLDDLDITFFHQLAFDTPQLARFISRTPKFKAQDDTRMTMSFRDVSISLPRISDGSLSLNLSNRT